MLTAPLALLVSDLHLSERRPETTALFLRFLAGPVRLARELYILGDLFDYWAGDDDIAAPLNTQVCAALAEAANSGVHLFFLPGNRDFLIGPAFAETARLTLLNDPTVVKIGGVATLLVHGDTLCTDDTDYMAFRALARSSSWQTEILAKPLRERKQLLESFRARSEAAKQTKSEEIMDANPEAIAAAFRQHGVTRMIHGHTHRQARHEHLVADQHCERWVLGDWHEIGNALSVDAGGCRWLTVT